MNTETFYKNKETVWIKCHNQLSVEENNQKMKIAVVWPLLQNQHLLAATLPPLAKVTYWMVQ